MIIPSVQDTALVSLSATVPRDFITTLPSRRDVMSLYVYMYLSTKKVNSF